MVKAGVLEGTLCKQGEYIRRLGADHNLEGEMTKEGEVAVGRRLKGLGRGTRLRRFARGRRKGGNLYRSAVLGASMYAAEVSMWSMAELQKERRRAAGHTGLRGMGVHSSLALFADKQVGIDPGYRAVKDPICRIVKEMWLRQVKDKRTKNDLDAEDWDQIQGMMKSQGDLMSAAEIWSLLQEAKKKGRDIKTLGNTRRKGHRHGPASVLAGALDLIGWEIIDPGQWRNRSGEVMDMRSTTPAMIQKTITNDWKTKQWEEAEGHIVGGIGANRSVVERHVQVWEKAKVVKVGIQWLAGVLPTPQWMSTKGWSIEARLQAETACEHPSEERRKRLGACADQRTAIAVRTLIGRVASKHGRMGSRWIGRISSSMKGKTSIPMGRRWTPNTEVWRGQQGRLSKKRPRGVGGVS
jgi:hypothetical protein